MMISINGILYNTEDIVYINTAYKIMGVYVIEIYLFCENEPVVLEYQEQSEYEKMLLYLKNNVGF